MLSDYQKKRIILTCLRKNNREAYKDFKHRRILGEVVKELAVQNENVILTRIFQNSLKLKTAAAIVMFEIDWRQTIKKVEYWRGKYYLLQLDWFSRKFRQDQHELP